MTQIDRLLGIMKRLRDPENGCPWDKEQTFATIAPYTLEETYEVLDAISREDFDDLRGELGDLLFQVVFYAQMAQEEGRFNFDDICAAISDKLERRHPHIFGDITANDCDTVLKNWEDIKRQEKSQKSGTDAVNDVPRSLPALMRSQKVQKRAGYVGFDYDGVDGAISELESELAELKTAISENTNIDEEIGDLIFSAVNVARFLKVDSEQATEKACNKFIGRFTIVENLANERGISLKDAELEELNKLWDEAKKVYHAGNCN